ncbi:MAG: oxygen-independent coproporphyrinogen III oxidase [Bacteroidia bacterium]
MSLLQKYNTPAPRYTSYPTVPYWQDTPPTESDWFSIVEDRLSDDPGLSLYIHLPFCEQLCTYCGCNTRITINHAVESPYIDTLLAEWDLYQKRFPTKPELRELHIGGGTPTFFHPDEIVRLINGITEHVDVAEDAAFSFEAHPFSTSKAHLEAMYSVGFRRISVGVQDVGDDIMKLINRRQTRQQVVDTTLMAREAGYTSVNFDLIYGLPKQTPAHIEANIELVKALLPERIAFYSYAHVPWIKPGQRAYSEEDLPKAEAKRALYEQGREALEALGYIEIGMDHFALPSDSLGIALENGTLHRNFMGYTPVFTPTLIGLGASSISDAWGMFVQNEKKVETYQQAIAEGHLPIIRGHELNEEDLVLRQHMLDVMCRFEMDWSAPDAQHPSLNQGLARLGEMQRDGLIRVKPFGVKITEEGKPFLRNAAMAFDARLWREKPEAQLFSQAI